MTEPARDLPDFTRAYLLLGQDASGNPVPVLVDGDGQFVCLLQGQIAGVKTTISVDADGRLEVFILDDESQWGDVVKTGNSELAARLGSPMTYDWRGKTLYCNTFADGLGLGHVALNGTGAGIFTDPTRSVVGGYSAKLTGGSDGSGLANLSFWLTYPPSLQMGIQAAFSCGQAFAKLEFHLVRDTGVVAYQAALQVDVASGELNYLDSTNAWVRLADVALDVGDYKFYHIKLVMDFSTGKYVRALFGNVEYDMSAISCKAWLTASLMTLYGSVRTYSRAAQNDFFYVDHVVLTVNEPS